MRNQTMVKGTLTCCMQPFLFALLLWTGGALASPTGAVLDLNISPEALTPRVSLTQMREAALSSRSL